MAVKYNFVKMYKNSKYANYVNGKAVEKRLIDWNYDEESLKAIALKMENRNTIARTLNELATTKGNDNLLNKAKYIGYCHSFVDNEKNIVKKCKHWLCAFCTADESREHGNTCIEEIFERIKNKESVYALTLAIHNVKLENLGNAFYQLNELMKTITESSKATNIIKWYCYFLELDRSSNNLYRPHINVIYCQNTIRRKGEYLTKADWLEIANNCYKLNEHEHISLKLEDYSRNKTNEQTRHSVERKMNYIAKGVFGDVVVDEQLAKYLLDKNKMKWYGADTNEYYTEKKAKKESLPKDNSTFLKEDLDKNIKNNHQEHNNKKERDNQSLDNLVYVGGVELMTILKEIKEKLYYQENLINEQSKVIETLMNKIQELEKGQHKLTSKPTLDVEPISPTDEQNKTLEINSSANVDERQTTDKDIDNISTAAADEPKEVLSNEDEKAKDEKQKENEETNTKETLSNEKKSVFTIRSYRFMNLQNNEKYPILEIDELISKVTDYMNQGYSCKLSLEEIKKYHVQQKKERYVYFLCVNASKKEIIIYYSNVHTISSQNPNNWFWSDFEQHIYYINHRHTHNYKSDTFNICTLQ